MHRERKATLPSPSGRGQGEGSPPSHSSFALTSPTTRARDLRTSSTPPERLLWKHLRNRRLKGFKFRRQHPIGAYVLDFYCHEATLCVEVDGQYHATRRELDARRDLFLQGEGISTLRFTAGLVSREIDAVCATILRAARERTADGVTRG
ncbi:MAG: DUF559 domain-containing protein [Planctomycetota bacterium]